MQKATMYSQTLPTGNGSTPATPLRQKGRLLGIHYLESALVLARPGWALASCMTRSRPSSRGVRAVKSGDLLTFL